jgi:hypothetical protein
VAKVNSGLQQLFHRNFNCQVSSFKDSCLRQRIELSAKRCRAAFLPAACRP